jgi:hypothetical protein
MNLCLPRANPFAVDAWFDYSCTLTFAVPREEIAARLPSCLEPDTFDDHPPFSPPPVRPPALSTAFTPKAIS